jgi:iron complex transport system ATP-binding protein
MIDGLRVTIDEQAVAVWTSRPLRTLSSAVVRGGFAEARAILNLHVDHGAHGAEGPAMPQTRLETYARGAGLPEPWVGLLTGARTEHAVQAEAKDWGFHVLAVSTVGLSNRVAAGRAGARPWQPSTINVIVVVDGDPEPAAMVNAALTVTEVKTLAMLEAGVRDDAGHLASGTSTDAVVIAATGRGARARFGGPASELGSTIARAARESLSRGIREWQERHP